MKIHHVLNLILVVVMLVGAFFVYQLQVEKRGLEQELASLNSAYGSFPAGKESAPQIIRLETNDPLTYRWRVYLPAGYSGVVRNNASFGRFPAKLGHQMPWNHSAEFLITQIFEFPNGGRKKSVQSHIQCINWNPDQPGPVNFTSGGGIGRPLLFGRKSEFFVDHWEEFVVEALETNSRSIEIDNETQLLAIKTPEHLFEEYQEISRQARKNGESIVNLVLEIEHVNK